MEHGLIHDLAICITVAWLLALLAQVGKQPLILAYLIAGIVIGPLGFKWVASQESIKTIAELGLILLLFMIGLEMDLKRILGAGRLITLTGASQILGGFGLGLLFFWGVSEAMELRRLEIIYLAAATTLSSTVIVVKLLYDKRELSTQAGRITLGVLVLQDVFAIFFLAVQPQLGDPRWSFLGVALAKALVLVLVAFAASRYALPPLFRVVSRLPELVSVGALAWCFLIGGLGGKLGLSSEMGALIAGVALSTFPYTVDVTAKVTSMRDFFLTLFFVSLGMTIPLPTKYFLLGATVICGWVVLSRLVTVALPVLRLGQGHRASLVTALNLCQVSEFSLVILALGYSSQHIAGPSRDVLAYAFILLAVLSTYAIMQSDGLSRWGSRVLKAMKIRDLDTASEHPGPAHRTPSIFLLGFSWTASSLLEELNRYDRSLIGELRVIDFNPRVQEELRRRGVDILYGDISQLDTLAHAGIAEARIIICSLPNTVLKGTTNLRMVKMLRELNPAAKILIHSELFSDVADLYAAGADYVCLPRLIEALELRTLLEAARNNLLEEKRSALDQELKDRQEVIP